MKHMLEMEKALVKLFSMDAKLIRQGYCGLLVEDR